MAVGGRATLVLCRHPQGRQWQLGPLTADRGYVSLLGWRIDPPHVDAGVHAPINRILAETLTGRGRVTFLWSRDEIGPVQDDDIIQDTETACGLSRLGAQLGGWPNRFSLMATRHAATATRMFDMPGFDWSLQGQIAVLSLPDAPPPVLGRETVVDLCSHDWLKRCVGFEGGPVRAVLRPGTDGDVAGLYCVDADVLSGFRAGLKAACAAAGVDWAEVGDEPAFVDRLTGQGGRR